MKTNQKGFNIVEGLLLLVIIAALAGVSWFVYQAKNKTNNTFNKTTQGQGDVQKVQNNQKVVTSAGDNAYTRINTSLQANPPILIDKYLTVKEWGVKIQLSTYTKDATYVIRDGYVYFIVASADKRCDEQAGMTRITDYNNTDEEWRKNSNELDKVAVKIDNTYYLVEGSQAACPTDKEDIQLKAAQVHAGFLLARRSIQKI